jgi:hypothetical protein
MNDMRLRGKDHNTELLTFERINQIQKMHGSCFDSADSIIDTEMHRAYIYVGHAWQNVFY